VRRAGAGNKPIEETHPGIEQELERLGGAGEAVDVQERGEARWGASGYRVSDRTGLRLLKRSGYSLQANQKAREGADHPDRDALPQQPEALPNRPLILLSPEIRLFVGLGELRNCRIQSRSREMPVRAGMTPALTGAT
jgi:hypothetical protein